MIIFRKKSVDTEFHSGALKYLSKTTAVCVSPEVIASPLCPFLVHVTNNKITLKTNLEISFKYEDLIFLLPLLLLVNLIQQITRYADAMCHVT